MRPTSSEMFNWLNPRYVAQFETLAKLLEQGFDMGRTAHLFLPFEGYRTPQRQLNLYALKRTTKAKPFQSAHQYGLAMDFVPWKEKTGFYWPTNGPDWTFLQTQAEAAGLLNDISWDRPHVYSRAWDLIRHSVV